MRKEKIIGIVPARMEASRFPGKPLYPICGKPMVEHVFLRAQMFKNGIFYALLPVILKFKILQ